MRNMKSCVRWWSKRHTPNSSAKPKWCGAVRVLHINITDASLKSNNINEIKIVERKSTHTVDRLTTQRFISLRRYYSGKTRTVCYMQWPDGKYPTSVADYVYVNNFQLQCRSFYVWIYVGNALQNWTSWRKRWISPYRMTFGRWASSIESIHENSSIKKSSANKKKLIISQLVRAHVLSDPLLLILLIFSPKRKNAKFDDWQ